MSTADISLTSTGDKISRKPPYDSRSTGSMGAPNTAFFIAMEKEHSKELHHIEAKRQDELRGAESRRQDELRIAEQNYQKGLAEQKQESDQRMSDVLTVQVKTTSELISKQLEKETTSLSNKIDTSATQQSGLLATLSDRIGKLEQARWEVTGKASVADPALMDTLHALSKRIEDHEGAVMTAIKSMGEAMKSMGEAIQVLQAKDRTITDRSTGRSDVISPIWTIVSVALASLIASAGVTLIFHQNQPSFTYERPGQVTPGLAH